MKKLIEFIYTLFGKYIGQATAVFGRKYAMAATIVAVWTTFLIVFIAAIDVLIAGVSFAFNFNQYVTFGFSLLPSNSQYVVSSILSAYGASWSYIFYMRLLSLKKGVFQNM